MGNSNEVKLPPGYIITTTTGTIIDPKTITAINPGLNGTVGTANNWDTLDHIDSKAYSSTYSKYTCNKCKKEHSYSQFGLDAALKVPHTYVSRSGKEEFTRWICQKCYAKAMDLIFGLEQEGETEDLLYGKSNE